MELALVAAGSYLIGGINPAYFITRCKKGVDIRDCKLAATFILDTPDQIFLTTADDLSGNPDFHRPDCFCTPILK